jgi:hypothetical protein
MAKEASSDQFKIEFALNRAVFFKQLTNQQADAGIKHYAALVAVLKAAQKESKKVDNHYQRPTDKSQWTKLEIALANPNLSHQRKGIAKTKICLVQSGRGIENKTG